MMESPLQKVVQRMERETMRETLAALQYYIRLVSTVKSYRYTLTKTSVYHLLIFVKQKQGFSGGIYFCLFDG